MRAPLPEFVRDLTAYDPLLRARWAFRQGLWYVERKTPERLLQKLAGRPNPWKSPRGHDLYDGWKEGYCHVLTVGPDDLNWPFVQERLVFADLHYYDRIEDVNRRLDALDEAQQQAEDRKIANWVEAATNEAYDVLQWRYGNRIAMTEPARPGYPADQVEQHDGFVVRDRRVVHA